MSSVWWLVLRSRRHSTPTHPDLKGGRWGRGFHSLRDEIDPGDVRFRVVGAVHTCMEEFMIPGWDLIAPGCGGTSLLSRRGVLAAR